MTTLDPISPQSRATPGLQVDPSASVTAYRLVYNAPEEAIGGHGVGWTLVGSSTGGWRWTMALAAHGAGALARPRVAKAVAVRVLAQHGIAVEAWADDRSADEQPAGPTVFLAVVRLSTQQVPEPRRAEPLIALRLRYRGLRGH